MLDFDVIEGGEVILDYFQPDHIHNGGQHYVWLKFIDVIWSQFMDTLPQLPILWWLWVYVQSNTII